MPEDGRVIPSPVPHGKTARRLEWPHLPPHIRGLIEQKCGSPVTDAVSQGGGFTPGFASVLTCEDGTRHFVKAASLKAQRLFADSYREEARKLAELPEAAPAPRLLWAHDADDWVVLGIEHVEARAPRRPWREADLTAVLDMLAQAAVTLTPAPESLELDDIATEMAGWPAYWDHVRSAQPDLAHTDEAAELAARYAEVMGGDTLVHTDIRDDNLLLCADGRVLLCDWNWPVRGADWLDSVFLMIGPRGDGLDVEAALAAHSITADLPSEHIDIALALITAFFLKNADDPVPPTSPHIRDHQRWQGEVCWDWLSERRGWPRSP